MTDTLSARVNQQEHLTESLLKVLQAQQDRLDKLSARVTVLETVCQSMHGGKEE